MNLKRLLYGIYFVSGASALIFEVLWFHQAGLAFGNSVWASSLILTGFMAGLAIGSLLAARYGARFAQPIRVYIAMELTIALTGVGLIYLLPALGAALAPFFSLWLNHPLAINLFRLLLSFFLLLIPSTAMGVTLPLLTKVLTSMNQQFGSSLGQLYGWNTLGAVIGVTLPEIVLIEKLGIHGTGLFAAGLNIMAAALAMRLIRSDSHRKDGAYEKNPEWGDLFAVNRWMTAAFLSGFCLLALEVIWFRFLALYAPTTTAVFAVMLAIVLGGIGMGGITGSYWLARDRDAFRFSASISFLAGTLCAFCYARFAWVVRPFGGALIYHPLDILCIGAPLMFPVSFASGIFFTLAGAALRRTYREEIQTTGTLTLANTLGAATGSFIGGFVLLPKCGMERSFFIIAGLYGCLGLLLLIRERVPGRHVYGAIGVYLLALALFPFGRMRQDYLQAPILRYDFHETNTLVATREGLLETIQYIRTSWFGKTLGYRMITNSFSMASTEFHSRRYMKLFAYWPLAVHPHLKNVLLISYGVGSTAKALTDTQRIASIDIVDISRDVLETNSVIYPNAAEQPLCDPRVRVHIEDGRFFLQTTDQRFDLITGEPPPPTIQGVVNLYTREYFQLMQSRLAEGGMVTYWLPMHSLSSESAKSIMKSFCNVFADCSLWTGMGSELMMVGTRHAEGPVSEEFFSRQWSEPRVRDEMRVLGFEKPEQLGALFIGDADYLNAFLQDTPPLVDNYPQRIVIHFTIEGNRELFHAWTQTEEAKERFRRSSLIKKLWPKRLQTASLPYFEIQKSINAYSNLLDDSIDRYIPHLHRILTETRLETPALWLLGANPDIVELFKKGIPKDMDPGAVQYVLGIRALSQRKYADAVEPFRRAEALPSLREDAFRYRIYALCVAGQVSQAQRLVQERGSTAAPGFVQMPHFWEWMKKTFGINAGGPKL